MTRDEAQRLDAHDPLASFRDRFVVAEPELIYLDGNSLGRLPQATVDVVQSTVEEEWGRGLVRSWHEWIDLPTRLGDTIAPLIGARSGEVLVTDQTSVNLYKLATAALEHTGRSDIVTDDANFPSDRYVLDGVARAAGGRLRIMRVDDVAGVQLDDVAAALGSRVGLVSLSHVAYKSGALANMWAITMLAHEHDALTLWDLSHSAGAVPVDLNGTGADLAVGCTYKYLNGGPGAPAYLFVRRDLQEHLAQPIRGWFGHRNMFGFEATYQPAPDISRFAVGTPPVISMRAIGPGLEMAASAGIAAIRAKSVALTELLIARFDERLASLGFRLGSPRHPDARGSHVALCHGDGLRITRALGDRGVVTDFRAPDTIRLAVAPLSTSYTEVFDAVEVLADLVATDAQLAYSDDPGAVT